MGICAGTGNALPWVIVRDVPCTFPSHGSNSGARGGPYSMHTGGGVSHLKLAFRVLCPRRLQLCELALEYLTLDGLAFLLEPMGRL